MRHQPSLRHSPSWWRELGGGSTTIDVPGTLARLRRSIARLDQHIDDPDLDAGIKPALVRLRDICRRQEATWRGIAGRCREPGATQNA
jgi:hypothetical protein